MAVLTLGAVGPAAASGTIRVALVDNVRAVELRGTDIEISELGTCPRCRARVRRMAVVRATVGGDGVEIGGARAAGFRLRSPLPVRLNGREYAPPLDILRNGEGLAVVNELPLEEYLVGVLRAETGEKWPLEALRAQAVVARTYAAYHRTLAGNRSHHILASTAHQQYFGRVPPASPIWGAVRETAGQVLLWEGDVFPAFYHTESGGYTEDPRTVFAARNMPALKAVRCEFSVGSPHYFWTLDVKLADLTEILRRHDLTIGSVTSIDVSERTPSLRASTVTVHGTRGSVRVRGNDFRRMIGYDTFKSTLFAVAVDAHWARFSGRGYGHGVGMCQWGAKGMAEQGHTARQILEFYYPGTVFGTLDRTAR
ncbi:MAG: SpoIID/LytB domain-containing protein [Candidatus Rokuibacteriota bacterium]|nr:MAG: SpoIID/LytB domain-containing protein [Candidatus Rokubacteria bacterium]